MATIVAAGVALSLSAAPVSPPPASVLALLAAIIVIAAVGAADDIRTIGVAPVLID